MRIATLDLAMVSQRDRQDWHELALAARRVDLPDDPAPVFAHSAHQLDRPSAGDRRCWLARGGDGELFGGVRLTRGGHENAHLAEVDVRVHPGSRRRGVGRALFDVAVGDLDWQGTATLFAFSSVTGPGAEFAAAMGMARGHEGLRNVLRIADTDPAEIAGLAVGVESRTAGFSLVRWTDRCPDELIDAFAAAMTGMNDAPSGTVDRQPVTLTAERIRRAEEAATRWGRHQHILAVRADATGTLAGITEVQVHPDSPTAEQGDTTVLAGYRGRGFGLWLKAAMLVWLADTWPQLTRYDTFNAVENEYMIAINRRLGYRTADRWCQWTRSR